MHCILSTQQAFIQYNQRKFTRKIKPSVKDECDEEETVPEEIDIESCSTRPSVAPSYDRQTKRRTNRAIRIPEHLNDYVLYEAKETPLAIPSQEDRDPVTVKEALSTPESNLWRKAMNEEITNLSQAQTWELTTKPLV
ncbi:hypothetical protein AVEN_104064-1 [Araneus ventricosus]|uniref:Retrovirus-related Pol polyprotein from transposon TNT 1-94 n=1 Tax=Araneus ventricosus TaxID=182803 RepID=A0A4Y2KD80_ARAVE|nr:hypothetical protein AVEN_104064-1 [Araneus ventricosus]